MSVIRKRKKVTVRTIGRMKKRGDKIAVLTAYDYFMAGLLDQAGIDIILVGDSAANVIHGHTSTLPIGMEVMVSHTAAVARGNEKALIVADMPFLSYQPSLETAMGGTEMVSTVKRLVECGIPVMGHIGLTPQSINRIGGPRVQGRGEKSRRYLLESALALEEAGCFSMVLELMDSQIASDITASLKTTATIGIGAGPGCDGQVLVITPRVRRPAADHLRCCSTVHQGCQIG